MRPAQFIKGLLLSLFLLYPLQFELFAATTANVIYTGPIINADTSDSGLTSAINATIAKNSLVQSLNVGIIVRNRIASLTGVVKTLEDGANIIAVVNSVPGVLNVDTSQLTVIGGQYLPINLILTAKVKGALIREQAFGKDITLDNLPITVETNNGIVYLRGMVDSQAQLIYIVKIAQAVPGVPRVIGELTVRAINVITGS